MKIKTAISPQFELCYGLADLVSPAPVVAPTWLGEMSPDWLAAAKSFGWAFWLGVPDILEDHPPCTSVDEFLLALGQVPPEQARRRLVRGLFHADETEAPAAPKREWLAFVGLDDWSGSTATGSVLKREAAALMEGTVSVLEQFRAVFDPLWDRLQPQLVESRGRADRLAQACGLQELARQLLLAVDVDEAASRIRALRGGYELTYDDETVIYLMPSVFNVRRFWTVADERPPATVFFPYFDPSLALPTGPDVDARHLHVAPDPWLVCRALGDPTRAAIVRRLARMPMTGAELGAALGLSKANISHHIFQLREAGLIDEQSAGRATRLSLRDETIANLSTSLRRELDHASRS